MGSSLSEGTKQPRLETSESRRSKSYFNGVLEKQSENSRGLGGGGTGESMARGRTTCEVPTERAASLLNPAVSQENTTRASSQDLPIGEV